MTKSEQHIKEINNALESIKNKKIEQFYFVACGGSMATLETVQYIFDIETEIPSHSYNAKEFVCRSPKGLGKESVVILCSHSGKTTETYEAASFAGEKGAQTFAISNSMNSPLFDAAAYNMHYDWGDDVDATEGLMGILLRFIFGILNTISPCEKYERAILAVNHLDKNIKSSIEKFMPKSLAFANDYKRESFIYTMASGSCYSEAYALTACFLMEMQWIHSASIHSGEFFHGPFEITDYDVPFILLKGIGATRVMDERAHDFLKKHTDKIVLIDAEEFDMKDIDEDVRPYFSQPIMTAVVKLYIDAIAETRGHMMSVRRYMGKLAY